MKPERKYPNSTSASTSEHSIPNSLLFNKSLSYQPTQKKDPLKDREIDYKNIDLLKDYLTESNKIIGSHATGVARKKQRLLAKAIKRAQKLALLPCC